LHAHAPSRARASARTRNDGVFALDRIFVCGLGSGRLAADTAAPVRAIELVDDVGAAVLVSLLGEPHVALGQVCPLRTQHRAMFPDSAGAQMCGERTISVCGAHGLWRHLLTMRLSTYRRKPSRWPPVPRLTKNSQIFDPEYSRLGSGV